MLVRYAFSIKGLEADETFHTLTQLLSRERYDKMQRYHFEADKFRSLYASVLLHFALKKHHSVNEKELKIVKNEYGKPSLQEYPDIHFNVSHSGDWVICAVSDFAVGVDVEVTREHDMQIAKRFYAESEYESLLASRQPSDLFVTYWTLKESYVKAEGKGMSIPFHSFAFDVSGDEITLQVEGKPCNTYEFQVYDIEEGVKAATCSQEPIEGQFTVVTLDEIKQVLL